MDYTTPYAGQSRYTGTIADLMGRRGDIQAQGVMAAAAANAQGVAGATGVLTDALNQYAQYKMNEPARKLQGLQLQQAEMTVQRAQRDQQGQRALGSLMAGDQLAADAVGPRQESVVGADGQFDLGKIATALNSGGYGDQTASLMKGAESINTSLQAHRAAQLAAGQAQTVFMGDLANGIAGLTKAGTPIDQAFDFAVQGAVRSNALDPKQVAQVRTQLLALTPEQQQAALTNLMDAGARYAPQETLADGANRVDRYGRTTATNAKSVTYGQPQMLTAPDGAAHLLSQGSDGQLYENGRPYTGPSVTGLAARPMTTPKTLEQLQSDAYAKGDMAEVARLRGQLALNAGSTRAPNTDTVVLRNVTTNQQQLVPKSQANALLSQGWVVNDPVQVRTDATQATQNQGKVDRANSALATLDRLIGFGPPDKTGKPTVLRQHEGLASVFGTVDSRLPTVRQSTADAEALINQVISMATLPEMQQLRGMGSASDNDMRIIQNGATTLQSKNISEAAAIDVLYKIYSAMERLKATAAQSGRTVPGLGGSPASPTPSPGNPFR